MAQRALQIESTGEHRTPIQQRLFGVVEQVVGPRNGVAQSVVAFQTAPRPDQQPQPLIEPIPHLAGGHRRHPRGRQFDGQRDSVEAAADLHHRRGLAIVADREARRDVLRPFDEQGHRGRVDACAQVQRGHWPQPLVGDSQPFTAGGHHLGRCRGRQDGLDQIGGGVQHVFAVVEDQQPYSALQGGGHALGHAAAGLLGDAQHRRHCVGHRRRIGVCGQFEKPNTIWKFIVQTFCYFERQPGLADPAHPGQRHQSMSLHRGVHLADLGLAPDEAGGRSPQVPRTRIQRPRGRELRA